MKCETETEDKFCGYNLRKEIWWQKTWKRRRYSVHSSSWSVLVRSGLRSPRFLGPVRKPVSRKTCPWWKRIRLCVFHDVSEECADAAIRQFRTIKRDSLKAMLKVLGAEVMFSIFVVRGRGSGRRR